MPRGRFWFGPGFWKSETNWVPGSGGFRGGTYPYAYRPFGRGFCRWFYPGYAPVPPWSPEAKPEVEADLLGSQAATLKAELEEIENRLAGLNKEQESS